MAFAEEAHQTTGRTSPTQIPSVQRQSQRHLNAAKPALPARGGVLSPQMTPSREPWQSGAPLLPPLPVTPDPPAMATANLVAVLGDAPPICSQKECFPNPARGRGSGRSGNPCGPRRGGRKNLAESLRGHNGNPHGAHLQNQNEKGGNAAIVADAPRRRGRG
jgi:hypothetical protein